MGDVTDNLLAEVAEIVNLISAKKDISSLDYETLNRCHGNLKVMYYEAKSSNPIEAEKIDVVIQNLHTIRSTEPPSAIAQLRDNINEIRELSNTANENNISEVVAQYNDLADQFSATTYNDQNLVSEMRSQLAAAYHQLNAHPDLQGLPLNKLADSAVTVDLDKQSYEQAFERTKVLAAGHFGECSVVKYTGDDPRLTNISHDGFLVLKKMINRDDGSQPQDEDVRQAKTSAVETHEREAALAGRLYDGVKITVGGETYIATSLIRNDLAEKDENREIEQIINASYLDPDSVEPKIAAAKTVGKSTTAASYLGSLSANLAEDGPTDCTENSSATKMIDTLLVFSKGADAAMREVHNKGFGHFDFAYKNIMVVENEGKQSLKAIDFGFSHQLSNKDGSHHSYRQDIYKPVMPLAIHDACFPKPDANGISQKFSIEDDFLLKKLTLLEGVCRVAGIDFEITCNDLVTDPKWANSTNEEKLDLMFERFNHVINNLESYRHEIADKYMSAFEDYLKSTPPEGSREEKMAYDEQAFAAASAEFEKRCVEQFSYGMAENANTLTQSGFDSEPVPTSMGYAGASPPPSAGYNSSPPPPGTGDNSASPPPGTGDNSAPPPSTGYNRASTPPSTGDNSTSPPPITGYNGASPPSTGNAGSSPPLSTGYARVSPADPAASANLTANDTSGILSSLASKLETLVSIKQLKQNDTIANKNLGDIITELRGLRSEIKVIDADLKTVARKLDECKNPSDMRELNHKAHELDEKMRVCEARYKMVKVQADAAVTSCKTIKSELAEKLPPSKADPQHAAKAESPVKKQDQSPVTESHKEKQEEVYSPPPRMGRP